MRIQHLSWSPKRKNHLVNFYALEPDRKGNVEVLTPQFAWASLSDAAAQISNSRARKGQEAYHGRLLHVVLDMSSGRLYLPNGETKRNLNDDPALLTMYDAIRLKITQLVDPTPLAEPISGDPIDTFRIRRIGDFSSVSEFVRKQSRNRKQYEKDISIPVIEADLSQMPKTTAALFNGDVNKAKLDKWAFIGKGPVFNFVMTQGNSDVVIHQQKPPFIVINIEPEANVSNSDKERFVVTAFREYAVQERPNDPNTPTSPELQSFKYLMYIGWSFRELSLFVLNEAEVHDFPSFLFRSSFLYNAAKSLKVDGYPDPSSNPYYYSFKIGEDFPIAIRPQVGVDVYDYSQNPGIFQLLFFDPETSYVTFKTPMFIPTGVLEQVFKPKSDVFVAQYDPTGKVINTISPTNEFSRSSRKSSRAIAIDVSNVTGRPLGKTPVADGKLVNSVFERKHISDYPQAKDIIQGLCKKLTQSPDKEARAYPKEIRFDDLEVIVGPWERTLGFLGGYFDARRVETQAGKKSIELMPGFTVIPPVIAIDNTRSPSVGDRTHIIIHEYRHHINAQQWVSSDITSKDVLNEGDDTEQQRVQKMVRYLRDPNEYLAHKSQFKYMLAIGMTKEQVLRQMLRGKPTISDLPVVKEYMRIINEASSELNLEESERESADLANEMMESHDVEEVDFDYFDPDAPLSF